MLYVSRFRFPDAEKEYDVLMGERRTRSFPEIHYLTGLIISRIAYGLRCAHGQNYLMCGHIMNFLSCMKESLKRDVCFVESSLTRGRLSNVFRIGNHLQHIRG